MMYRYPPKSINGLVGYRSSRSMINQDTWDFANKYCAILWIKIGIVSFIVSILIFLIEINEILSLVIVLIQTFLLLLSIVPVEKALRNTFDENGNRRI